MVRCKGRTRSGLRIGPYKKMMLLVYSWPEHQRRLVGPFRLEAGWVTSDKQTARDRPRFCFVSRSGRDLVPGATVRAVTIVSYQRVKVHDSLAITVGWISTSAMMQVL